MIEAPSLTEFRRTQMTFLGSTRTIYRIGDHGPGVVLMHEIPGMTPDVLRLGKLLALQGFRVALPSLFGTDGRKPTALIDDEELIRMCVSAEFSVFAANKSSRIVDWLRELCRDFAHETGGNIGAVGLCITGGFALSLTVDTDGTVRAPVMSEPSLPFPIPFTSNRAAMHLSTAEQEWIRQNPTRCIGLRFTGDWRCRSERFDAYQTLLGDKFHRCEIQSPDKIYNIGSDAHSVLTQELSDSPGHPTWAAFERVIEFLRANL
jgi:dienelactone hydrolase